MTSFCFIANYHLTPLQIALARRLERDGVRCSFVAVNGRLAQEIRDAGWNDDALLYMPFDPAPDEAPLKGAAALSFNDLILADRALRHNPEKGLRYLYRSARKMSDFFENRRVDVVLSEPTWAHERLAAALCKASGQRKFLTPFTIRYPTGRWGFFEDAQQARLFPVADEKTHVDIALDDILGAAPPSYLMRNNQLIRESLLLSSRLDRLRRFITRERIDPFDPTHIQSRWHTLRVKGGEEINRFRYGSVHRMRADETLLNAPFVLFALHKQPEASIDVFGRFYEDQEALLIAIWRTLPLGWKLLVKEHTNAIGDRPPAFYRRLSRWPGLEIIDETMPMVSLLDHARAVFTVSGTVAYEAAMRGIAAFTFAPMFFNSFPRSRRVTLEDLRQVRDVAALIDELPPHDANTSAEALRRIAVHSFSGRFTDTVSDQSVLDDENLNNLMVGFRAICSIVSSEKAR